MHYETEEAAKQVRRFDASRCPLLKTWLFLCAKQAIEKVDGMMIGEKTVQAKERAPCDSRILALLCQDLSPQAGS